MNATQMARAMMLLVAIAASGSVMAQSRKELDERLARVEAILDGQGLLELLSQVESLQQQVQALRGQLDVQNNVLREMRAQQRDGYNNLDARLQTIESGSIPGLADEPPLALFDAAAAPEVAGMPAEGLSIETTTDDVPAVPADVIADIGSAAPVVEAESVPVVRPEVTTGAAEDTLAADIADTEAALAMSAQSVASPLADVMPEVSAEGGAPARTTVDSPESEAAYQMAFNELKNGQYEAAVTGFRDYLAQFPESQYVDNAQYWLGESFYVMRRFDEAIAEYRTLLMQYPDSAKRSHAMLKIGYSYYEMKQLDLARAVLEDLKVRFPGTTAARLADERILRIRQQREG
ncbi:MAG: tol-pal system protein YbgF [Gammaproteobacteria bacterium]|nr:tol-pal system protein YbgF [Gammaproteobacteria bacterium]